MPARPNIVVVMVDDASEKVLVDLPKIQNNIVLQGATLRNYLVNQPLCAPSRATIMRGQYAHNTGIVGNRYGVGEEYALHYYQQYGHEQSNIATWFQNAGYRTGLIGKYLNGYGESDFTGVPWYTPDGWNYFFAVGGDAGDGLNYWAWNNGAKKFYGDDWDTDYLTDVISQKSVSFIDDAAEDARPFLLFVTPKAPHHPAMFHPDYASYYTTTTYPKGTQNPAWDESNVTDKHDHVRFQSLLDSQEKANIDENHRFKLRAMRSVDDLVENIVDALGAAIDNTYLIFCSDNGFHSGEHRMGHGNDNGGKNNPYEEDIRIPLYIRGPEIDAQLVVDELVGNVDIAATLCDIADVVPNDPDPDFDFDGRSFLPLLLSQPTTWRNYYLLSRGVGDEYYGVRSSTRMFAEWTNIQMSLPGEFYNLVSDPHQETSTYAQMTSSQRATWQARVTSLRSCVGASCRIADV